VLIVGTPCPNRWCLREYGTGGLVAVERAAHAALVNRITAPFCPPVAEAH
jgi:hypothetical protein